MKKLSDNEITVGELYTIMTEGFKNELRWNFQPLRNVIFDKIDEFIEKKNNDQK